ncbi:NAD(P)/FAD-dependent oxidoreductase [Aestuariispira ectoiniformans]|uniref:NAD(P)/FAD-dependent oxidoreductase n=1 Tax=Aestuariispira ectoiniformans TaxID=2775080 RepID=UPI00223AC7A6|nr:FAD-binding oxidoreductase [Aestuariispira ectoiniformans]
MKVLYHAGMYNPAPVPSYWEATANRDVLLGNPLSGNDACDVAIIGGGFTGLSAALHLARDFNLDVRVLDGGPMGWGASGRNGGFCCLPATKLSIKQMIGKYGLEETRKFWASQLDGVDLVRSLAGDEGIDYDLQGDGNLEVAHRPSAFEDLREYGEQLKSLFGINSHLYRREEFAEIGFDSQEQFGALKIESGFALHPLKFSLGLAAAAQRHGATLYPNSLVTHWEKTDGRHVLRTEQGSLAANKVIVATNGFTREGMHRAFDKRMLPVISNILVTRPLSDDELAAQKWQTEMPVVNTRNLLFYFRMLKDRRFMIGARGDWTGAPEDAEKMKTWLTRRVGEVFPAWRNAEVDYFWRGFVCMTRKFSPSLGQDADDPSLFYGYAFHANGVNTAPWVGMKLAEMVAGKDGVEATIPAVLRGHAPRFPFAGLRLWYLRASAAYYRWQDD